jgi:O-antigen/teichoic acid export membrane protein
MRLDLYSLVTTGSAVLQICLVPAALALGGGLVTATAVAAGISVMGAWITAGVSARLLPSLLRPRTCHELVGPLVRFGGATTLMTLAGVALMNAEKLLVVRLVSVTALAFYSVAFTIARLLVLLPGGLSQPLLPALAQLHAMPDIEPLRVLYTRALRGLVIWMLPAALLLCTGARSLLSVWAGAEYAREGALPLCILVVGCTADGISYVPRTLLSAAGRPDLILRCQMINLLPYLLVAIVLIHQFGIAGAATAWSLRAVVESLWMLRAARKRIGSSSSVVSPNWRSYAIALSTLSLPVLLVGSIWPFPAVTAVSELFSLAAYSAVIWFLVLTSRERARVSSLIASYLRVHSREGAGFGW